MKKTIKRILIASVIIFYSYEMFNFMTKNDEWLNDKICDFAKQEVKSKVYRKEGHGGYNRVFLNDSTRYYYQISKVVVNSFKKNTYKIDTGDSIVKEANSKKIIVYRGDKKSIYVEV